MQPWVDTVLIALILVVDAYLLREEVRGRRLAEKNHELYSAFFAERTRWYAARGKPRRPPDEPEVALLVEAADEEPEKEKAPE